MPHAGQTLKPLVKLPRDPAGCWEWLGPKTENGHGKKTFAGRDVMAHRWLWQQLFGPIPDGLVVYATCETKGCVNPQHLACGTQAQACRSSVQTKLLPADVAEIKAAREGASLSTAQMLADRYGIAASTVRDIWRGCSWSRARKFRGPKQPRNQHSASAPQSPPITASA